MDLLITLIMTFIGAMAIGLGYWLIKKYVHIEIAEVTDVKNLMIVQHFNTGHFAQMVDMSLLESHGFAKLDQYFVDIPFDDEEMEAGGFQRRFIEADEAEGIITYWKVVPDTELIFIHSPQGDYWLWGKESEENG
jgi:hypothetical protein